MGNLFTQDASGILKELEPTSCDKESVLELLIADHPRVLGTVTDVMEDELRWLLIDRQFKIPGSRYSVDVVFVDDAAMPTIVVVKLASNPEIRRDVFGQIMQYAAYMAKNVNAENLQNAFRQRCERSGKDFNAEFRNLLLEPEDDEEFWKKVDANLQNGCIRLIIVTDQSREELEVTLEHLRKKLPPADLFGVAIEHYADKNKTTKILAPQLIGARRSTTSSGPDANDSPHSPAKRPSDWSVAVQFNPNKSIQDFFLQESKTQNSSVSCRKLYYNADGQMRWRLQLHKSGVNMYQQMRFKGDLQFWKQLFPHIHIRTPDEGRQLTFNLTSVEELVKFTEAVRPGDGKFAFFPRNVPV